MFAIWGDFIYNGNKFLGAITIQVTAVIQNNTLIIPNVDLSQLKLLADENGLICFDLPILDRVKPTQAEIPKPSKKLSLAELLAKKTIKSDIVATVEEMNESIGQVYANKIN
ncbi:hypothetical protein LP109_01460 [Moraxella bovis]|uniref:Uncharacterized protein n=1 Tax=Moraxella bovis TaxID=476 RepID=A0A378PUE0_MORBO|nr:hypothetical protein [Moraxella bovis]UZA17027.1 hypothetical protein LP109_01460 [Moraxella bovis]UZA24751.1 hypothetical protein LP117_13595 [Moraxella bovis]STY90362.1 Uncharacterised protein [Moraxella bovis]